MLNFKGHRSREKTCLYIDVFLERIATSMMNEYNSFLQVISSFFGTIGFFLVEWKVRRTAKQGYVPVAS